MGQSKWVTIYQSQVDDYDEDVYLDLDLYLDLYNEFDPTRFTPGQMSVGSGCELFVATDNCINVSTFDGKLKRQIACDRYRDGELSKVEGIFATGDDYLFACNGDYNIKVYTTDGEYLNKFGGDDEERQECSNRCGEWQWIGMDICLSLILGMAKFKYFHPFNTKP